MLRCTIRCIINVSLCYTVSVKLRIGSKRLTGDFSTCTFFIKSVRYHCGGWSEEVNSCILIISYIHGLFITLTQFRLLSTFSNKHLYTHIQVTIYMAQSPCFLSPLADSLLLPLLVPFTYLETLLAVTGFVHLGLRLLVN
jgi:hypothetical protein